MDNFDKINNLGIYLHIPFCREKCNYCDFLTIINYDKEKINLYVEYLCKEIRLIKEYTFKKNVDTIYFGGGTPSLLSAENIYKILNEIKNNFYLSKNPEITIEINPETINEEWIKDIAKIGITRASVGFQNSNTEILKLIGRDGSLSNFKNCIQYLKKYNITNVSADIILALPKMDVKKTLKDSKIICDFEVPHISAYSLILSEKTKLYRDVKNKKIYLPNEIIEREIYHKFCNYLKERGYYRYEISSFCKKGYESKHNKKYWDLSEYIGLGLGASGLIDNMRTKNPIKINEYYKKIDENKTPFNIEYILSLNDMMSEFSFLSLRTSAGINKNEFKNRFNKDFDKIFNLNDHFRNGLIYEDNKQIKLTEKGFDLSNIVETDLLL